MVWEMRRGLAQAGQPIRLGWIDSTILYTALGCESHWMDRIGSTRYIASNGELYSIVAQARNWRWIIVSMRRVRIFLSLFFYYWLYYSLCWTRSPLLSFCVSWLCCTRFSLLFYFKTHLYRLACHRERFLPVHRLEQVGDVASYIQRLGCSSHTKAAFLSSSYKLDVAAIQRQMTISPSSLYYLL